jgi:hypothetical protein
VRQTARGAKLDTDLVERAKAIVERYDRATLKGHEAPNIVPLPAADDHGGRGLQRQCLQIALGNDEVSCS